MIDKPALNLIRNSFHGQFNKSDRRVIILFFFLQLYNAAQLHERRGLFMSLECCLRSLSWIPNLKKKKLYFVLTELYYISCEINFMTPEVDTWLFPLTFSLIHIFIPCVDMTPRKVTRPSRTVDLYFQSDVQCSNCLYLQRLKIILSVIRSVHMEIVFLSKPFILC